MCKQKPPKVVPIEEQKYRVTARDTKSQRVIPLADSSHEDGARSLMDDLVHQFMGELLSIVS